jgi:hypothetical protein
MWDDDTLHAAVDADRAEVYPMPGGRPPEDDDVKIDHLLNGLWKLDDKYVIEGECPVSHHQSIAT